MESVNLKLKFTDALKMVIISSWLPFGLGIGLAAYQGNISLESLGFVVTLLTGLIGAATLIVYSICYLTLTSDGLNFKNWRGRDVFLSWDENMDINSQKYNGIPLYTFKHEGSDKIYKIPKVLFSYAEVQHFIRIQAPPSHKVRRLNSNQS